MNRGLSQFQIEDSRSLKKVAVENELIEKHELVGQRTEFGTENSDRFSIQENEELVSHTDPLAAVDQLDVIAENAYERPHNKADDSTNSVDGAVQASASQLCSLKSTKWASAIIGTKQENPAHTRTQVKMQDHMILKILSYFILAAILCPEFDCKIRSSWHRRI